MAENEKPIIGVMDKVPLASGGISNVSRTTISMEVGEKIRFPSRTFTIKEFKLREIADKKLLQSLEKHSFLKMVGIPVIPTYRKISDTEILMTDLTNNGNYSVYSPNNNDPVKNLSISKLANIPEILEECDRIFKIALQYSLYLHPDCMFIVMDTDGIGKVFIGDFDEILMDSKSMPLSNPLYKTFIHILGRNLGPEEKNRKELETLLSKRQL